MLKKKEIEAKRKILYTTTTTSNIADLMNISDDDLLSNNNQSSENQNVSENQQKENLRDAILNELQTFVQNRQITPSSSSSSSREEDKAVPFTEFWNSRKDTYPALYQVTQYVSLNNSAISSYRRTELFNVVICVWPAQR